MNIFLKIFVVIIHLVMLFWILWLLWNGGTLLLSEVFYHIIGLSLMGFGLIRGTSALEMFLFKKEKRKK